ncbi:Outer membrane protein assembly factor BamA [Flavobacteriaceae bacterium MAR_2010_188]|nr:Outer membrane protein assembly factor BamA [Flavobacteriaceae bacterium MAR_2010_188]
MPKSFYKCLLFFVLGLILFSCSITKYIPEGERLYTGAEIEIVSDTVVEDKDRLKSVLETTLRPEPNTSFLGMQPGLYYYYKNQKVKPGFINRWLYKQLGEEPVYQSDVEPYQVEELLLNRLENRGFFYSIASSKFTENDEKKTASVKYTVDVPDPYTLATYQLDTLSPPIYQEMQKLMANSQFFKGMRFDLNNFKIERERMDFELKKIGYYNFNSSFLIFESDTNQYDDKRYDLYLKLKKDVPKKSLRPYQITQINVYPDYDINMDSTKIAGVELNGKTYIQDIEPIYFKPKHLDPFITIEEGQYYDPLVSKNTARRLSTLGIYKYVNIQYKELDSLVNDSLGILHANIYLSPLNKRAFRAELQAVTKSNNFAGPAIALTYTNRNTFQGGENLSFSTKVGYEKQVGGGKNQLGKSSLELGFSTELVLPRMIFPVKIKGDFFDYSIPRTVTGFGVDYLNRTDLYQLLSGNAKFGYVWNANRYITHQYNPISVIYTKLSNTTEVFEKVLRENPFLALSFEQQFISGMTYSFIYNGLVDTEDTHNIFLNTTLDVAGNLIGLFGKEDVPGEPKSVFNQQYAQFAKADIDLRYHYRIDEKQTIATRLFAGYGLPYGNSEVMPYIKQYFSGGPYSVRAFRIRSLGPGTYSGEDILDENGERVNIGFFDQTGNIRLEANVEYRFPLFGYLKGAFFADAGNIWNSKGNPYFEGKDEFSSDFISELGMGAGFGIRFDLQGFVIRLDLAAPFHDPTQPKGERFNFDVASPVLNFAIGYPF